MKLSLKTAAALLLPGMFCLPAQAETLSLSAGSEYRPFTWKKEVEKGSVLDFSGRLDAPAGKYGPVVIRDGKFAFRDAPGKPVRFYGTNLCRTAQFLPREWAEKLADRMAAAGYNAIRIHHYDDNIVRKGAGGSTELDPAAAAQLDYLIHCLKQRGIYINTDLYVSRILVRGELSELPEITAWQQTFKPLVFVLDSAMENWKKFARNMLTHVNPHTGFALKDEPALISISLVNEDNLGSCWNASPAVEAVYRAKFEEWKKRKKLDAGSPAKNDPVFCAFLAETYERGFEEMKNFVRSLGYRGAISDQNMLAQPLLSVMRSRYDFVENHFYWDHPNWPETPWKLPSSLADISAVVHEARAPARIFASRLFGKPMLVTEFDFAAPNRFRAEGAVLTGAYASLQDWDGLFQFTYSHNSENVTGEAFHPRGAFFNLSTDAVKSLSQLIGARLFLDRELKAAPLAAAAVLKDGANLTFADAWPADIERLGLFIRVGSVLSPDGRSNLAGIDALLDSGYNFPAVKGPLPVFRADTQDRSLLAKLEKAGVLKPGSYRNGACRAANGQVLLDSRRGLFRAVTPGCETLILPENAEETGSVLSVKNRTGRGVFAAISHDGRPLPQSGRILLLHLTDSQPEGIRFGNGKRTRLEEWGGPGYLAADGEAEITLKGLNAAEFRLYAVDTSGRRSAELPLRPAAKGGTAFTARVHSGAGAVFTYELIRR